MIYEVKSTMYIESDESTEDFLKSIKLEMEFDLDAEDVTVTVKDVTDEVL